jgi:hypothetical protein
MIKKKIDSKYWASEKQGGFSIIVKKFWPAPIDCSRHKILPVIGTYFLSSIELTQLLLHCQGSCLCGTVNNRGKVIYCYGDLVPRHGELFAEGAQGADGGTSSKDLLAAQLGVWTFGIFAL